MCGVAGLFDAGGSLDRAALEAMIGALAHRGPDGAGVHIEGGVGLAHRRLSIIDPALGQQPFVIDGGALALSYNGEIYNYIELREELKDSYTFTTDSDTEVLIAAYRHWGIGCLERFRGMFAFALYDRAAGKLHLVRDRLGIKPLYYWTDGHEAAFASELQALILHPRVPRRIDPTAVREFFARGCIGGARSIYAGVCKLAPGHRLEIDCRSGAAALTRYWQPRATPLALPESELLETVDAKLRETVHLYVRSDVPFGAFLSGGVDSSVVCALMARELKQPVESFSIAFRESRHSELPYAEEAARGLGLRFHPHLVEPQGSAQLFDRIATHFGEPFADSSAIPTYFVSHWAAQQVKMVLTGDGGDETFAGYDSYREAWADAQDPLGAARRFVAGALAPHLRGGRVGAGLAARSRSPWQKHLAARTIFDDARLDRLLRQPGAAIDPAPPAASSDPLLPWQIDDLEHYLPDDVLTKVDRMSMANSIELRVPFGCHPFSPWVSARRSHALAIFQSRAIVSGETRKTSAVSSTVSPPKYLHSTTRHCLGCNS